MAAISLLLSLVRFYYGWLARRHRNKVAFNLASRIGTAFVWITGVLAAGASVLYVIAPGLVAWAALPLPIALRWIGAAFGLLTVLLFFWIHRALGANWAMPAVITKQQTLVTDGPYQFVRHPMYAMIFVWALAYFLMTANAFIGLSWLGLGVAAVSIIRQEEAALREKFGAAYNNYMQTTGRLLPHVQSLLGGRKQ